MFDRIDHTLPIVGRLHGILNWRFQLVALEGLKKLFGTPDDPVAAQKIANTLAFASAMRGRGFDLLRHDVPHRLTAVAVGDVDPAPGEQIEMKHGDEF